MIFQTVRALPALALAFIAAIQDPQAGAVPAPVEYFGFPIGSDGKLVSYKQGAQYLTELAKRSKWIQLEDMGRTTLGQTHWLAAISKPENLVNGARWKDTAAELLNPATTPDEAQKLAAEGKCIVMITCGIHSDEVASPQTALELAHDIITNTNLPFDRDKVFENVILLIVPSVNPDGQEMIADWVSKTAGTPDEGAPMPYLYHFIAGHDNNRDWFAFNLAETRNISNVLYRSWRPHILMDHHQMGSRGARFFIPPFGDPLNPAVHPLVWRGTSLVGQTIAYELESAGKAGVAHDSYFQGWWQGGLSRAPWWQGGLSRAPWWHHGIGILTETASANLAFPLQLDAAEVEPGGGLPTMAGALSRHPNPWRGGTWRVRDICDYQRIATFATLKFAAGKRDEILLNSYKMAAAAAGSGISGQETLAWAIPAAQHDPGARDRLVEMLRFAGVDVVQLTEAWNTGTHYYEAGSYIISLAQPFGPYANDMLSVQKYPELPNIQKTYDITGWTLPAMMGVKVDFIRFTTKTPPPGAVLTGPVAPRTTIAKLDRAAKYVAIHPGSNDGVRVAMRFMAEQKTVRRAHGTVRTSDGREFPPGSWILEAADVRAHEELLRQEASVNAASVASTDESQIYQIRGPKIGLYEAHDPSMDKGWSYLFIDRYIWKPQLVRNEDVARVLPLVDVFVIPESAADVLWDGGARSETKGARIPFPKEYRGGLGAEGVKNLRAFVEGGGTLIALGTSCDFLVERLDLPVTNVLKNVKRDEFSCPGSLIQIECDITNHLAFGMAPVAAGFFASNIAFRTSPSTSKMTRSAPVRYPLQGDLLVSGQLTGGDKLRGTAGVVEFTIGKGRVVLFGLRPQHRVQTDATFKLLINAVIAGLTSR